MVYFVPVVLLVHLVGLTNGEVFTALADMEKLIATEQTIIKHLEDYIEGEANKIERMKTFLADYQSAYNEASKDTSKYLANPINAFLIVKQLTADWKKVEGVMSENIGAEFVARLSNLQDDVYFPSDEDLRGAAAALMRLQDTYQLDTHELAKGRLLGKQYSRELTAGDCCELGRQSYNKDDHYHTVLWMAEALAKSDEETTFKTVSREEILDYLSFSTFQQGNVKEALQLTYDLLKINHYHQRATGNRYYFENVLRNEGILDQNELESKNSKFNATNLKLTKPGSIYLMKTWTEYERLCRGEKLMDPKVEGRLRCRYITNNHPYLLLAPIKEEEAYLNPRLVIYHDVVSDAEGETAKMLAQPRFQRATVQNRDTGIREPANYRISKSAWLSDREHKNVARVSRRISAITGLDMNYAEELQVVNYGIGGHYEPHFDYADPKTGAVFFEGLDWGNRIATWLSYLSDVESGGATVFPELNVVLRPVKGAAAFWYNLLPNGEGNELTRHAACPVLTGSKWVANKWIHEYGQEFRRPCSLKRDAKVF